MADPSLIEVFRSSQLKLINSYNKFLEYGIGVNKNSNTCAISEFVRTRDGMNSIFKFLKDCSVANGTPKIPNDKINNVAVSSHVRLKHKQKKKWKKQEMVVKSLTIEDYIPRSIKDHGALSGYFGLVKSVLSTEFDSQNPDKLYHQIWYDSIVTFMLDHLSWLNSKLEQKEQSSQQLIPSPSLYDNASRATLEYAFNLSNSFWLVNGILSNIPGMIDKMASHIDNETLHDCVNFLNQKGIVISTEQDLDKAVFHKSLLFTDSEKKSLYRLKTKDRHIFIYTIINSIRDWCIITNNQNPSFNMNLGIYPLIDQMYESNENLFIGTGQNLTPLQSSKSIDSQILIPILFENSDVLGISLSSMVKCIFSSQSGRLFIPCIVVTEACVKCYCFHRSGGFSSESIDLLNQPLKLCKLFLSFLLMDEQSMGYDTSLRVDRKIPNKEVTYWTHPRNGIECLLKDITVHSDSFGSGISIRQVMKTDETSTNRINKETYFLKTFWQEITERRNSVGSINGNRNPTLPNEVTIYQIASENRVRFIPTCVDFGYMYYPDGGIQDTNSVYWRYLSPDTEVKLKNRVNTWILLSASGKPEQLYHCQNLQDIFLCLRDIVISHWDLHRAGILHRNISRDSLWMTRDSDGLASGMLAGLDMAVQIDIKGECEPNWKADRRYMSINMLKNIDSSHQFYHDMESIFWWIVVEAFPIVTSTWGYLYFETLACRKEEFINNFLKSPSIYDSVHPLYKAAIPHILELKSVVFDIACRASLDERWMYDEVEQTLTSAAIDSKVQQSVVFLDEEDGIIEMNREEDTGL